jgi:hypothetical protein
VTRLSARHFVAESGGGGNLFVRMTGSNGLLKSSLADFKKQIEAALKQVRGRGQGTLE